MAENAENHEELEEVGDSQSLAEIDLFFDMAIKLEENKFNLYPDLANKMQLKCIQLILQRLEFFEFEQD
jgi:hypothetical protein